MEKQHDLAQAEQQEGPDHLLSMWNGLKRLAGVDNTPEYQQAQGVQAGDDYQLTAEEIAERQAFNRWRVDGIDGGNCSPAAAAWLAWQARAALATQPAVQDDGSRAVGPSHPAVRGVEHE